MTEEMINEIRLAPLAGSFVFPSVVTDEEFSLLFRNRAAQKLLPAPWRLKRYLKTLAKEKKEGCVMCAELEEISYFVCILPPENSERLLIFLENFMPFCEPFSKSLFGESLRVLDEICLPLKPQFEFQGTARNVHLEERVISRTHRLRGAMEMYRHFLTLSKRPMRAPSVCSLPGILQALSDRLHQPRVSLSFECTSDAAVMASPDALIFALLNVIRFLYVYQGLEEVSVQVKKTGNGVVLSFSFSDQEQVFSVLARIFRQESGKEFPKDLALAPLFLSFLLCREHHMNMSLKSENGMGQILIKLPSAQMIPEAFLGTKTAAEHRLLDQWIREIFFYEEEK